MVTREAFHERVGQLRETNADYLFLKTGAYRPADLARAIKYASEARLDLLTIDGAGGGTGMSPWRMMNEWVFPPSTWNLWPISTPPVLRRGANMCPQWLSPVPCRLRIICSRPSLWALPM